MPPLRFYLKGIAGLVVLFVVTLFMAPTPALSALRAMIGVGLGVIGLKMTLRYCWGIDWPPRRR
jgi:hypothetical protein